MISKILVPIDGTKASRKAIDYVIVLSKQTGAAVTILAVSDKNAFVAQTVPAPSASPRIRIPIEDYLRSMAEAAVTEAEKRCKKRGLNPATVVRSGHPVKEILKEARRSGSDLIVIGSHGKGALESAVLGSVTYGLIHSTAKYPILVVRG